MTLYDFRGAEAAWIEAPPAPDAGAGLGIDDLLSGCGDDLGIDVDGGGCLVLIEGCDFE